MRRNNIRAVWDKGQCVVNGWLAIPAAFSAEVMAHCGWDSLCIDIQHGLVDYQIATTMMQAISTTPVATMVRVPWNDPAIIMKCLDAGAFGIVCPMINTADEAARFAGACRYPPLGYRSLGPIRAQIYGGSDYALKANDEILALAMIETTAGRVVFNGIWPRELGFFNRVAAKKQLSDIIWRTYQTVGRPIRRPEVVVAQRFAVCVEEGGNRSLAPVFKSGGDPAVLIGPSQQCAFEGGRCRIVDRTDQAGNVPRGRCFEPALGQATARFAFEIDDVDVVLDDEHLAEMEVAMMTNLAGVDVLRQDLAKPRSKRITIGQE